VIALFYTSTLRWAALGGAAVVLAVLILLNRAGVRHPLAYTVLGVVLWLFVHASGVHATVAGVLLALTIPSRARAEETQTPLQQMERALQGVVAFVIVPLFALANAGVPLGNGVASALRNPVALGVALGLLLGKPLGITVASYAAVRTGIAHLPAGVSWRHVHGASWVGGIGFTMSLFIAGLAFADPVLLDIAKLGVLGGSLCAGLVGYWLLSRAGRPRPTKHTATRSLVAKHSK
jgi:NhaA family Na+:H+ antiporter